MTKLLRHGVLLLGLIATVACSTTASRIRADQTLFDSYPPEVQQNIRNGVIEPGYTREMVRMALGKPDRTERFDTEAGAVEVWRYEKSRPGIGFGIGTGGMVGSNVGIGTGVSVGEPPSKEEQAVVEFRDGRVTSFRTPQDE